MDRYMCTKKEKSISQEVKASIFIYWTLYYLDQGNISYAVFYFRQAILVIVIPRKNIIWESQCAFAIRIFLPKIAVFLLFIPKFCVLKRTLTAVIQHSAL